MQNFIPKTCHSHQREKNCTNNLLIYLFLKLIVFIFYFFSFHPNSNSTQSYLD